MTVLASLALLVWLTLILLHGQFWQSGPTLPAARPATPPSVAPSVAIIAPARDEAGVIVATLHSLLAQDYPGRYRVILVDDGSTDGTGALARGLNDKRLRVLDGTPPPAGWSGKLWAVAQGVDRASDQEIDRRTDGGTDQAIRQETGLGSGQRTDPETDPEIGREIHQAIGQEIDPEIDQEIDRAIVQQRDPGIDAAGGPDLLLLTDADIVHDPRHLSALVARVEQDGLDLVSEMVALACDSRAERALVPAFVYFFQLLYPFAWVNDALRATAAAAGGTILIRRRALDRIGGIAAVRGALIDDVALARAVKRGGSIWLGHSEMARSVRSYPDFAAIWRLVARTAYVQLGFSPLLLVATMVGMALTFVVPPAAALFGHGPARWLGALAWAGMAWSYVPTLRRFGRSAAWAVALPAVAGFYMAATIGSAVDYHRGRGVRWKQRDYQGMSG